MTIIFQNSFELLHCIAGQKSLNQ